MRGGAAAATERSRANGKRGQAVLRPSAGSLLCRAGPFDGGLTIRRRCLFMGDLYLIDQSAARSPPDQDVVRSLNRRRRLKAIVGRLTDHDLARGVRVQLRRFVQLLQ